MADNETIQLNKPEFVEVNYKILSFKYPAVFDREITSKIVKYFEDAALKNEPFLSEDDLENIFKNSLSDRERTKSAEYMEFLKLTSWHKKNQDDFDIHKKVSQKSDDILKTNFKMLIEIEILKSVLIIQVVDQSLVEVKKYYIHQINNDLNNYALEMSKNEIIQFVLHSVQQSKYPFTNLPSKEKIHENIVKNLYHEANHLLHLLIAENYIIKIPLLIIEQEKEVYKEFLFLGRPYLIYVKKFLDEVLIPTLKLRYPLVKPFVENVPQKNYVQITIEEITPQHKKLLYHFCFTILEARKTEKEISINDFNLAQLILNCWLSMELDPLLALREFPNIELGSDFLSPFLSQYISDFSHIEEYLASIKEFIQHLPQVIEKNDLIKFFKVKGLQPKLVEEFLIHLPRDILLIPFEKQSYLISKIQIVKAIFYLYNGNYYKSGLGKLEFEVLVQAFFVLEKSFKDFSVLIDELKTTPEEFNKVKRILKKNALFRTLLKGKDSKEVESKAVSQRDVTSGLPVKKIYTESDFDHLNEEEKEKLVKSLNLMVVECVDMQKFIHEVYIRKSDLSFDDARFFRGNPTYELICKRFNL
ncbi:MAG: hypothetical protein OEV44_10055 [Spirochaetota bacterium]|nr:hypothetical protein [Spirochaetota bacterium]